MDAEEGRGLRRRRVLAWPSVGIHARQVRRYWDEKIARNIERDRIADAALREMGWTVLRFWDFEVRKECDRCVAEVEAALLVGRTAADARVLRAW